MPHRLNPAPLALAVAILALPSLSLAEAISPHLEINGFATAGGSWVSKDYNGKYLGDPYQPGAGIDEKGSYQQDSVLGVQLTYSYDDRLDMVGQIVAAGTNDFQAQAEWAYIGYRVNDNLRVRAGRFAAPWYMYTENSHVGQAYPWARLPVELYKGIPINSLDGFDLLYRQPLGDWNLDAQVTVGGAHNSYVRVANNTGLNINLSHDAVNFHLGYSVARVGLTFAKNPGGNSAEQASYLMNLYGFDTNTKNEATSFADAGMTFDDGTWMAVAEFGALRIDGWASDINAGYLSVGHYYGKWLPYALASKIETINKDQCTSAFAPALNNAANVTAQANGAVAATTATVNGLMAIIASPSSSATDVALATAELPDALVLQAQANAAAGQAATGQAAADQVVNTTCDNRDQTSYSLGFRYDATKNVSVKFQIDEVRDFKGTQGYFNGVLPGRNADTQVYTFNVNAAF